MENSMMKRGIGAVVLAVIAALLLAYLLKGKSEKRQDVVDMKLPGAPEMNIPSLSEAGNSIKATVDGAAEKVTNAGSAIIDSAKDTTETLTDSAKKVVENTPENNTEAPKSAENPGFSIRPNQPNTEEREIVDTNEAPTQEAAAKPQTKEQKEFKPRLVEEKKVAKKAPAPAKKAPEPSKKPAAPQQAKKPSQPKPKAASNVPGKYAIQLLATSSSSRANKLSNVMRSEGYNTFITETSNNNKVLYRVRIGGYDNRSTALKAQEGMKRRYKKNFFVQNSLVVSR